MIKTVTKNFLLYFCLIAFNPSIAAIIDFETVPGSTPIDGLDISNQYLTDFGVTFSLQGADGRPIDDTPYLEKTGNGDTGGNGFWNAAKGNFDTEAPGFEGGLGNYFLRFGTGTFFDAPGPVLIIDYANPVSAASAQIWDIDAAQNNQSAYEAWTVTARDGTDSVIDTQVSPNGIGELEPDSLNGKPWTWSFDRASNDIFSIAIGFTGEAEIVGLAFDNFSPASSLNPVPVPAAVWLFGTALIGLVGFSKRRKAA
jgi:hypothetical protein